MGDGVAAPPICQIQNGASLGADQLVYAVTSKVFVVAARRVSLLEYTALFVASP